MTTPSLRGPEDSDATEGGAVDSSSMETFITRVFFVGLFVCLSIELLFWEAVGAPFETLPEGERFFYDPGGANHLFGLAVCGWMLWRRSGLLSWTRDGERAGRVWTAAAVAVLCGSIVLRGWAAYTDAIELQLPAIALFLMGGAALIAGGRGARAAVLPALVLLLSAPIPTPIVNALLHPMQLMTAEGVASLLRLLGIEHRLYGEQIHIGSYVFYVIEGCAGLRTLQTFGLAVCVLIESLYRDRKQVLFLIALWPISAIGVNQLRVLMIVLWPESGLAEDHASQGILMIVLGVMLIAMLDVLFERYTSTADSQPSGAAPAGSSGDGPTRTRLAVMAMGVAVQLAIGFGVPSWSAPESRTPRAATLPVRVGEFVAYRTIELDSLYLGSVRGSDHVYRRLRLAGEGPASDAGGEFEMMILVDDHRDRSFDVVSRKSVLAHPGWSVRAERPIEIDGVPATYLELQGPRGREEVIHWYLGRPESMTQWLHAALALGDSPFRRAEPILSVRVAALREDGIESGSTDELETLARSVLSELRGLGLASGIGL